MRCPSAPTQQRKNKIFFFHCRRKKKMGKELEKKRETQSKKTRRETAGRHGVPNTQNARCFCFVLRFAFLLQQIKYLSILQSEALTQIGLFSKATNFWTLSKNFCV